MNALKLVPALWGGVDVLERAGAPNGEARAAIEHLRGVVARLKEYGLSDFVTLDLAENRGMAYYTGILFEGFVEGLGFSVASGGRYDNLIEHFGPSVPAVGFAIGVERAMMVRRAGANIAPEVIAQAYTARVAAARAQGQVVEVDVLNRPEEALREYARVRGAKEIWWRDAPAENLK
jgi:ATP phosphoribosyltransferase regulatory subunit